MQRQKTDGTPVWEVRLYYLLAFAALVGTWTFNIKFMLAGHSALDFIKYGYLTNALATLTTDLGLSCLVLFPWMVREGRRYGLKHVWAYLVFSMLIAVSVMFPLFLAARRKAILQQGEIRGVTKLTGLYPIFAGVSFVLVNFFVVRHFMGGRGFAEILSDWFSNDAGSSLAIDLFALAAALLVFLITEARRGRVRRFMGYVLLSAFGIAFVLPWLLRELDAGSPLNAPEKQ